MSREPSLTLRDATPADAAAIAEIYNQSIAAGDATLAEDPWSAASVRRKLAGFSGRETILVLEDAESISGWGIIKRYSDSHGYRFSCETAVYLRRELVGRGFGTRIKRAVIDRCRDYGYHHLVAKILADNRAGTTRAAEQLERLYRSAPDDLELGLRVAKARIARAQVDEARAVLDDLGRLPSPRSQDPRIALLQAEIHQGSPDEALEFARRARERAEEMGARSLAARALLAEAGALQDLGQDPKATRLLDQARQYFDALGDRRGTAKTLELQAIAASMQGLLDVASNLFRRAEQIYGEIGSRGDLARLLVNQGTLQSQRGRLGEAENLYGRALTIYDGVGAEMERATTLINLGSAFHEAAELAKALKKYQDALELFTRLEHEQGKAAVLTNIAEVHFLAGRLDRAQELHREALAANIAIGEEPGRLYDLFRLGDLAAARGDSVVARQKYGEALSGMEATGDFLSAAEVKVALAALELVGGESQNAATLAGQAEQVARTEGATDVRIRALLVLGRSVLARRNLQKVRETVEEISWLVEGSTNPRLRLQCATLTAQAQAASGRHQDVDSALAALERIITETAERQLIPDHLEARLAKIEIEIAAGLPEADGERQTLIREAGDKGFGSIVDRAEVLH